MAAEPADARLAVDASVSPCQDFYAYACGPWIKANPSPPDQSRWGVFTKLFQDNQTILKDALDKLVAGHDPAAQRVADFYRACMDEAAANEKKALPIEPILRRIAELPSKEALGGEIATLQGQGIRVFFAFGAEADYQNAKQDIAFVRQSGLGMANRDYYLRNGEKDEQIRKAYVAHVAKSFQLLGDNEAVAADKADTVLRIETQLAEQSLSLAQLRDPHLTHHKLPVGDLRSLAPDLDWDSYLRGMGAPSFATLNIAMPDFIKAVNRVIDSSSLEDLKTYLAWHVVRFYSPLLSKDFVDEDFAFYGKTLTGVPEQQPRWKRCVRATDLALGEDLGQYFVKAAFGPAHKKRMLVMVADLRKALDEDIDTLVWMGPATKKQAHVKLAAFLAKIGYPDHWRDYGKLTIRSGDLTGNVARAYAFEESRDLAKIGKPHDKKEWRMTPPTVNAYYNATENDINFPAGILQPPFFDMAADDAVNFGAIGVVIGHEITHGFDNQGRKYDKDGNLKDWWTEADAKQFTERAQCVEDQYGSYRVTEDVKQNGAATLGENLADNGGLRIALAALHQARKGKKDAMTGGFTADQRFFIGFAHVWCSNARDEARRNQALTDVHSLPEFRVNGTVSNSEAFAKAFNCKAQDPMVRGDKACRVW
jgi:endothelin-converting enzyme/putative endopeptidase